MLTAPILGLEGCGGPCHRTATGAVQVSLPTLASMPTGLEISGPFAGIGPCAHWPGDPGPLPDMTVPGFTHGAVRASTLFDGSQHAHFGTHG